MLTVDNLEVAQYFYMLLNSSKVRELISTTSSKVVLLLGRFTGDGKVLLNRAQHQLREFGYVPLVFDSAAPMQRDFTELLLNLAHMSKFILAFGMGAEVFRWSWQPSCQACHRFICSPLDLGLGTDICDV